jgi:transcriptional regulator with XRE-family HTH domain
MQPLESFAGANCGLPTSRSIPSSDCLTLKRYLTYVAASPHEHSSLSFTDHLKRAMGKTSGRDFAQNTGVDHSTFSRILNSDRTPSLPTVARTIEGAKLSDTQAYQIIIDSATVVIPDDACRFVFSDSAPALEGTVAEQLKGYRKARGLSQRVLADRANVDHTSLSRIESSQKEKERVPGLVMFANLACVLGLNVKQVRGFLHTVAASRE